MGLKYTKMHLALSKRFARFIQETVTAYDRSCRVRNFVFTATLDVNEMMLSRVFLRTTACNAKRIFATAEASFCLSVRLSVTLLYCVKTTQLRIMKSSLLDSLESLVSNEVILVPLGEEIPLERGHERGVPP